jgi:hypothetical protein
MRRCDDARGVEGAPEAYVEGAAGTAAPMLGVRAIGAAGKLLNRGEQTAQTAAQKPIGERTAQDMFDIAQDHYNDIKSRGIYYTNPEALQNFQTSLKEHLYDIGGDPRHEIGGAGIFTALDDLTQSRRPNGTVEFQDVDHIRKVISGYLSSNERNVRRIAGEAIEKLDDWLKDPQKQEAAGVPPELAGDVGAKAEQARAYWRAGRSMEAWDKVQKDIDTANNPEGRAKTLVRQITLHPESHPEYTPEAIKFMEDSLDANRFSKAINKYTHFFAPHSPTAFILDFLAHHLAGPMGGLGAAGTAALIEHRAGAAMKRVPEGVRNIIRYAPTGQPPPPPPTLGQRTGAAYSQYVGPIAPPPAQPAVGDTPFDLGPPGYEQNNPSLKQPYFGRPGSRSGIMRSPPWSSGEARGGRTKGDARAIKKAIEIARRAAGGMMGGPRAAAAEQIISAPPMAPPGTF